MTSPMFALYLTCLFLGEMVFSLLVHQESSFVSVKLQEDLTLQCFYEDTVAARLYWYIQILGQKPRVISTFYIYDKKKKFHDEFQNNSRFTLDTAKGRNHLTITDMRGSDSATYNCIRCNLYTFDILASITVSVQGSGWKVPASVQQSASETIQPGDSVILNCTVHTGTCDGHHSVYWFKDSEESYPGLIYTHGGRDDQCKRKPDTQTHTCVYNLPMKSPDLYGAGTYYCAVASCGHILFGGGTKLGFEDEAASLDLVYFLSGALVFSSILSILLAFLVCVMNKRTSQSTEAHARLPGPFTANAKGNQHAEMLYYGALSVNLHNSSRRQRDQTCSECVYYRLKQ